VIVRLIMFAGSGAVQVGPLSAPRVLKLVRKTATPALVAAVTDRTAMLPGVSIVSAVKSGPLPPAFATATEGGWVTKC
jgi:hypothetical protein